MILCLSTSCVQFAQPLLMDRGVFVKSINLAWLKVQIFLTSYGGSPSDLAAPIKKRLNNYPTVTKKSLVFDKYEDIPVKYHERMRRASELVIDYDLSVSSHIDRCNYEKQIQ